MLRLPRPLQAVAVLALLATACGSATDGTFPDPGTVVEPPADSAVTVEPAAAALAPQSTLALEAVVSGAIPPAVTWSVEGGASAGSVSAAGVYTAPATPGTYRVLARSVAAPEQFGVATITVTPSPPPPTGPQLWVATNGNDANPGTEAQPWRTIQKAMNAATAGSTVNVRAGTYVERLTVNVTGQPGKWITFQPAGFSSATPCGGYTGVRCAGDEVVLDYASLGVVSDTVPFLRVIGKSFVRIQGFTFRNHTTTGGGPQRGVLVQNSTDVDVAYNKFLRNGSNRPWNDVNAAYAHFYVQGTAANVRVRNNEFGWITTARSECLSMLAATGPTYFDDNWFHDIGGIAMDIAYGSRLGYIRGNLLEFVNRTPTSNRAIDDNPANAIYVDGGVESVIERNVVRDSAWAIATSSERDYTVRDIVIRNNVLYRNRVVRANGATDGGGIFAGSWYAAGPVSGIVVTGNTIHDNHKGIAMGIGAQVTYTNNIVSRNTLGILAENTNGSNHAFRYNLLDGNGSLAWGVASHDGSNVTAGAAFVNAAAGDLRLQAGSPALNAGDPTFVPASGERDAAGAARVAGGRVDVGAYERP